jgi:hypothetical protein
VIECLLPAFRSSDYLSHICLPGAGRGTFACFWLPRGFRIRRSDHCVCGKGRG